jgi:hypothetical protein
MHMLFWDYGIPVAAEHKDGERLRDTGKLGGRVPLLATKKREDTYNGPVSHHSGKRSKGVFNDEGSYLWIRSQ